MLDGVFQGQNTSLALSFITDVRIFLSHTDHHTLMARAFHDGRENSPWSIISSESSLAHTGSIINN